MVGVGEIHTFVVVVIVGCIREGHGWLVDPSMDVLPGELFSVQPAAVLEL